MAHFVRWFTCETSWFIQFANYLSPKGITSRAKPCRCGTLGCNQGEDSSSHRADVFGRRSASNPCRHHDSWVWQPEAAKWWGRCFIFPWNWMRFTDKLSLSQSLGYQAMFDQNMAPFDGALFPRTKSSNSNRVCGPTFRWPTVFPHLPLRIPAATDGSPFQ